MVAAAVGVGGQPVGGQEPPPISVEPSTGLVSGQVVVVTVNTPGMFVNVCDSEVGENPTLDTLFRYCGNEVRIEGPERPAQVEYTVLPSFSSYGGHTIDCGVEPGDCLMTVAGPGGAGWVGTPISIEPPPLAVSPSGEALADGATVDVFVRGTAGETLSVAQCASPVPPARAEARCGPAVDVLVGADGRGQGELTVAYDLETGGEPVDCQAVDCAVAAFAGDALVRSVPITMQRPVAVRPQPSAGLRAGAYMYLEVTGYRPTELTVYQCAAGATGPDGACVDALAIIGPGSDVFGVVPYLRDAFTGADGTDVSCGGAPADCVIAVGAPGSDVWVTSPLTFARTALTPASGLLDGQPVTVTATGLEPGVGYRAVLCDLHDDEQICAEPGPEAPTEAAADGTITIEAAAGQRFDPWLGHRYCRDECSIGLAPADYFYPTLYAPYVLAEGSLAATPASGLADGDTVTLTGTDLMSTYAGPAFWIFPSTGGWGIGQCDAAVLADPTILGFFTHCASAPPGVADVAGSTVDVDVTVESGFTAILGDQVDCTASADACVLTLARVEQDGSVSMHAAPVRVRVAGRAPPRRRSRPTSLAGVG